MAAKRYLGLRFPFTAMEIEGFFLDLDYNPYKEIKSDIMHLLFTPKGQRVRMPNFGTNLLRYIFEPNDDKTKIDIKIELQETIKKFIPSVNITDLKITNSTEYNYTANVEINYTIDEGSGLLTYDTININI